MQNKRNRRDSNEESGIESLYYGTHKLTFRIGTYLALIRMMGIAHLVARLYSHSKLVSETHARLRRTRQTIVDLIRNDFDSPAGRAAIARLQEVHRHLDVREEDFHYVLATFFLEPLRWNERHAKKTLSEREIQVLLSFWMRLGQEMNIGNLPRPLSEWRRFQDDYEATYMCFSPEGQRLAQMCLRDVVKLSLPRGLQRFFRQLMVATTDPFVLNTLRLPHVRPHTRLLVQLFLRTVT
jgi:hypothetical protein